MLQTEPTYIENKDKTKTEIPPNPYIWLSNNKRDMYYQDGEYYTGRDEEPVAYKDVPKWFFVDLKKSYTPEVIAKWGIELPKVQAVSGEKKSAPGRPRKNGKFTKASEITQEKKETVTV